MWISPLCYKPLACKKTHGGGNLSLPRTFKIGIASGAATLFASVSSLGQSASQAPAATPESAQTIIDQLLSFIYSLGHLIGEGIVRLITTILPSVSVPAELIDPIGLLAILTIFLAVAAIAKKLVWIVVIVGWALILIRLIIVIVQSYL